MAHREIEISFDGQADQTLQFGPVTLKSGEKHYLPLKNTFGSHNELLHIANEIRKKGVDVKVKKVDVVDEKDLERSIPKGAVVKQELENKVNIVWRGAEHEKTVRGLGSFFKGVSREVDKDVAKQLVEEDLFEYV